ncbi:hypothetical protein ACOSQ4_021721 [Xanthoceras sorbifolium]
MLIDSYYYDEINQLQELTCPSNDDNINEDSLAKVLGVEKFKQLEAKLEVTNDQVTSLKEMINMIIKQNKQLLNRGVQVKDAVGSHACTPHVFMPQSQHESIPITQDMSQFENARYHLLH